MDSEKNILFADFKILNDFLYKYFLINLLINFYLFIFNGIFLPLILYTFSIIVFLIRFSKI